MAEKKKKNKKKGFSPLGVVHPHGQTLKFFLRVLAIGGGSQILFEGFGPWRWPNHPQGPKRFYFYFLYI
jgi:hypothetical protein